MSLKRARRLRDGKEGWFAPNTSADAIPGWHHAGVFTADGEGRALSIWEDEFELIESTPLDAIIRDPETLTQPSTSTTLNVNIAYRSANGRYYTVDDRGRTYLDNGKPW